MTFVTVRCVCVDTDGRKELTHVAIELGILVWQDFMFGCGQVNSNTLHEFLSRAKLVQYPAYNSFTKSVEIEAEQNVKRLRHHPSIVIFGEQNPS